MRTLLALLALAVLASCGCEDDPDSWENGRPRIDKLKFLQQLPQNPYALQFSISFFDDDGDVHLGTLRMSINGNEVATLAVSDVYAAQVPPIEQGAVQGEMEVVVRLLETDIPVGQRFEIGFILDEGDGECAQSNQPTIVLQALMGGSPTGG